MENAVQRVQGQYRSMKSNLETEYGMKVAGEHPALVWLVRHAAMTMTRFSMGADGMTPYKRTKGKNFTKELMKFGECVWYLKPKSKGKAKAEYRWAEGIWLGVRDESGEHIIGTKQGVLKVRAVRGRGSHAERWNKEEFNEMRGLPWEPVPGRPEMEMKSRIEDGMRD